MVLHALHHDILPPSGIEHVTSLKLIPHSPLQPGVKIVCNLVVARSNLLHIFDVREEPLPPPTSTLADEEREKKGKMRKGTEAVEGEVEMEERGDGFINVAQSTGRKDVASPTITRIYHVREHRLHGVVTGLAGVKTLASAEDHLERLVVSFKDAKIALLEWSDAVNDLQTVSIHTYERAPQMMSFDPAFFRAKLRSDPESRCVALALPKDALAILPFHQSQVDVDMLDPEEAAKDIPYSPSFVLDLAEQVDESIRNVIDFTFLPGFNNPTVAVLFQTQQTWTGRMTEYKDTVKLIIFTVDLAHQQYPIITSVSGLPYDSFSLLPCLAPLVGVTLLTANSIIYIDTSRRVSLPVNGWAPRVSDMPYPSLSSQDQKDKEPLTLEGAQAIFADEKTLFVILTNGTIYPVEIVADGKIVSKLVLGKPLARTTIPEVVRRLDEKHLLVGSVAGDSVLLRVAWVEEEIEDSQDGGDKDKGLSVVADTGDSMDFDEDDDLYGVPTKTLPTTNGSSGVSGPVKQMKTVVHLSLCDSIPATGPISDMTFALAKNGERYVPELVAATGSGTLGGFSLFQRDLPSYTKRKLHAIGGARGIAGKSARNDVAVTTRIAGTTIGAAPFFQRTTILQVMSNAIRVLEPDGGERQSIKDLDASNIPRPKTRACSICDPFVLIFREDDSIGLYVGETERGKIRRKDMSAMGDKTSRYLTGCFYTDTSGLFAKQFHPATTTSSSTAESKPATTTLHGAVNAGAQTQWLILVRPQGIMEIWALPKLTLVFSTSAIPSLQSVLSDSYDPPALSLPQDPPRKPQDMDVEQILIAPVGETSPRPYLFVFIRSGQLAVYEITACPNPTVIPAPRTAHLDIHFVQVLSRAFDIQRNEETEKSVIAEQKRISRQFIPFVTSPPSSSSSASQGTKLYGVFFTGDRPSWLMATDKSEVQIYPSGHAVVHSFTTCSLWESKAEFLLYTDEGPTLMEWIPDFQYGGPLPMRSLPRGRPYSNVLFDASTNLVVAASTLDAKFASFDEDGNCIWEPEAPNITMPTCECSTLELISPDFWVTLDGYEFATNEFINDICCVSLETSSTESGIKDFIAVGTSIVRGEDLAVKGATYIFEIVEVVPDANLAPSRWYKFRLMCRDDAKGPVTALAAFDGYLVSSMGQKIFVRAFDLDERLVGVAFLDVGLYVTSLKTLKNMLLVGDAVKSVMLVAFQEDPYKLVILGKDIQPLCAAMVDFFFVDEDMMIVTCDEEGVMRAYDFDPNDPESKDGKNLILRAEFHAQVEYRTSILTAKRSKEDPVIPQARLLCGPSSPSLVYVM
ncbi:hypothetical protein ONZ45_g11405 [Pleurotus djamor]|nr:hypothetical protein ONZ45_g11405 [Pleurotus djamor]